MKPSSFASLLHASFMSGWAIRGTFLITRYRVCSYRDTWKMFLQFTSHRMRREITQLSLADLQASEVLAFLDYLEKDRKVSIGTRNCRLAAIHSFFAFVAHREPLAIAQCTEIARIPVKKRSHPAMCYMDAEEIAAVLRNPFVHMCLLGSKTLTLPHGHCPVRTFVPRPLFLPILGTN